MKILYGLLLLMAAANLSLLMVSLQKSGSNTALAEVTKPTVTWNATTIANREYGELVINNMVTLRISNAENGFSPSQRAQILSDRLSMYLDKGYTWKDVNPGTIDHHATVQIGDNLLVTVSKQEASANEMSAKELAAMWSDNIRNALQGKPVTVIGSATEQWPDWTKPDTKIVPIFSLGTPGVRLGFAQVSGPEERVKDVKSVVQLDADFRKAARVRIFVPSSELAGMNRVQGVAVTALLQYGLFRF